MISGVESILGASAPLNTMEQCILHAYVLNVQSFSRIPYKYTKIIKPNKQDLCVDGESRVVCLNHFGFFFAFMANYYQLATVFPPKSPRLCRRFVNFYGSTTQTSKKLSLCGIAFSQQTNMYHRFMFSILIRIFRFISSWQMMRFFYFCKGLGEQSAQTRLCYLE